MFEQLKQTLNRIISPNGNSFDKNSPQIKEAWEAANRVVGSNPEEIRKDVCGAWIVFNDYQNPNSKNGWAIDYYPVKSGDTTALVGRALHIKNKNHKDALVASGQTNADFCIVTAK